MYTWLIEPITNKATSIVQKPVHDTLKISQNNGPVGGLSQSNLRKSTV